MNCARALALVCVLATSTSLADASLEPLRSPQAFDSIRDRATRSNVYFTEAAKVLQHPRCLNCHPATRIPASMAWQALTTAEICEQIKDPKRNGNRTLAQIEKHLAEDHLVGWAWHPGEGRVPAPGTQAVFGELIAAWIKTGAHCERSR